MTDRKDPTSDRAGDGAGDDAGLKRLLGVLKPPKPSEILRARVENAIHDAPASAPMADAPDAPPRMALRQALYGRIAASVILAAGIALGTWLPPPQPIGGGMPVAVQWATGTGGSTVGNDGTNFNRRQDARDTGQGQGQESGQDGAREQGREGELGLALVGGGTPVTGIGLVRAQWDVTDGGTDTGFGDATGTGNGFESGDGFGGGFENAGFEGGDENSGSTLGGGLDSIPLY